ncbi:MAG: hypothetical protein RLZZ401_171 [Pseudomonadota bacterium]
MPALRIYAGPKAHALLAQGGLQPGQVRLIPAAAGGPKGLILGPLDRFIFGDWLPRSTQPVHLLGASIGAWRMATACLDSPVAALARLEHDYLHQDYAIPPGRKRPSADQVSEAFGHNLAHFYAGRVGEVLAHPRFRLHVIAARGRHLLRREQALRTPLGYLGAFVSNALHRKALGAWLERVVFSSQAGELPFATRDYRTRQVALTAANFAPALQASCSIPFVLRSVSHIPGAPAGAYWDGGLTDYHLHLDYRPLCGDDGLVLYPHFQKNVVPGWLDKGLKWRHGATPFLDHAVVLAPDPQWVKSLPNGRLPDRSDFTRYGADFSGRVKAWSTAVAQAQQLADEFQAWLARPTMDAVCAL